MGYAESSGDIPDEVGFKIADWRPFCLTFSTFSVITSKQIHVEIETSFLFQLIKEGVLGYAESSGDIPDDVRYKMADCRPFCLTFSTFYAHNFKTNRDRDFLFVSKKGFWGMPNLVVIFPMMSDTKWPTGGYFV